MISWPYIRKALKIVHGLPRATGLPTPAKVALLGGLRHLVFYDLWVLSHPGLIVYNYLIRTEQA